MEVSEVVVHTCRRNIIVFDSIRHHIFSVIYILFIYFYLGRSRQICSRQILQYAYDHANLFWLNVLFKQKRFISKLIGLCLNLY